MNTETGSEATSYQDQHPEHELSSLQLQLETRERLVRLEEENRHLRERVGELQDKQKQLRRSFDDERTSQSQQNHDRFGKLGHRVDGVSRRLDRLFSFWMISTMLLMLFTVLIMLKSDL